MWTGLCPSENDIMKNTISRLALVTTLFWISSSLSCASLLQASLPALENRTLRLSADIPGFEYQYEICAKRFLGICTKHQMTKETYDLTDPEIRKKLINMGFIARVREKP